MGVDKISLTVISPEKILYTGEANSLKIPGIDGYFGVLPNHASMISELDIGIMEVNSSDQKIQMVIEGGFVEVKTNLVSVLTGGGDLRERIDLHKAKSDLEKWEKAPMSPERSLALKKAKTRIAIHEN
ncbi:MAG: ATP synthase F1 subunit epsilon [Leptospiraceae bacterium]|nr:ATP synthase F1 subunit epsilon [Leptospiraceae bacterium]MCK6381406.1 ATP synthase F1 subunit epsilon [Leptospiraceae bacterium]NUM41920.1 ATP synthase F1 subunit epsilon [Leptospiraceae bacterium]